MNLLKVFIPLFIIFHYQAFSEDDTANIGDKLDANNIAAPYEYREEEFPNRPDHVDENDTPAKLEERLREEQIEPVPVRPDLERKAKLPGVQYE